jgi:hypothetical protein
MSNAPNNRKPTTSSVYRVHIREHLPTRWSAWFAGAVITHRADGGATIEAALIDQAALYGLISRLRDLGLTLLAVERIADS